MNTIETIASGAIAGLALWYGRKWFRQAMGFKTRDEGSPLPPAEPFATQADTVARLGDKALIGSPRPGVEAFKAYVLHGFGGADAGIWGDPAHQARASEHNVGRAWDWKVPAEGADALLSWLSKDGWKMARRLGIGIVIHKGRIWSAWIDGAGPMQRAYTGPNPHNGHVHFSFTMPGAMGRTSGYAMLADER
jgi:hypothetical protein